jgi:hypothetical protein
MSNSSTKYSASVHIMLTSGSVSAGQVLPVPSSYILVPVVQVGCCMTLLVTAVTQQHITTSCRVAGKAPATAEHPACQA